MALHGLDTRLPKNLAQARERIERLATDQGLDPYQTVFCMVDYRRMNQIASYGGFPTRYPHWRFGMEYDRLSKSYTFGMHRIYELVINNDPCYAFLLEANAELVQRLVIAHVFGHSDFFRHNLAFSETNRRMMDEMANHATQVRRSIDRQGLDKVETFIDVCLSVENLIDPHGMFFRRGRAPEAETSGEEGGPKRLPAKSYMDEYVNPPEFIKEQARKAAQMQEREQGFPDYPRKDVLTFVLEHAPLENWQQEILEAVRDEAYYFVPQRQTKIMNEGWATYWHSRIMTEHVLEDAELFDYANLHAGTLASAPGQLNPYKVGVELFRDIKERWDRGMYGPDYESCDDAEERRSWDRSTGEGLEKIFEVRKLHTDITFIDTFLTKDFCERQRLFTYDYNQRSGRYEISSRDFEAVKTKLVSQLTNFGQPEIYVVDGNFRNRGELYLKHRFAGVELRYDHAVETLRNLCILWRRPVRLETQVDDKLKLLGHDGEQFQEEEIEFSEYHLD